MAIARRNANRLDWDWPDEGSSGIIYSDDPQEQELFAELEAWDPRDPSSPLSLKGPPQPDTFDDSPPGPSPKIPFGGVDWSALEDDADERSEHMHLAFDWDRLPSGPPFCGYRSPPPREAGLEGALEAGQWFRLRHPELVGAVMEYEMSWAFPRGPGAPFVTDLQDDLAKRGLPLPRGGTFGPAQFSPGTIMNIEKKFIDRRAEIPNQIREHLLPLIGGDYDEALRRSLDPHWTRLYLAADIYLWELDHPDDPLEFVSEVWNKKPGGLLSPLAKFFYLRHWRERGPGLLEKWRE